MCDAGPLRWGVILMTTFTRLHALMAYARREGWTESRLALALEAYTQLNLAWLERYGR